MHVRVAFAWKAPKRSHTARGDGLSQDISAEGISIVSFAPPPPVGSLITYEARLPGLEEGGTTNLRLTAVGRVVRSEVLPQRNAAAFAIHARRVSLYSD
ncbi:MAG TPA: hypothetical protein VGQ71_10525 [Terriglobales bacterium]|jgi:hypothetical protein|nr:hypothetical protein [Terriglobales bacterium]